MKTTKEQVILIKDYDKKTLPLILIAIISTLATPFAFFNQETIQKFGFMMVGVFIAFFMQILAVLILTLSYRNPLKLYRTYMEMPIELYKRIRKPRQKRFIKYNEIKAIYPWFVHPQYKPFPQEKLDRKFYSSRGFKGIEILTKNGEKFKIKCNYYTGLDRVIPQLKGRIESITKKKWLDLFHEYPIKDHRYYTYPLEIREMIDEKIKKEVNKDDGK